MKRIYLIFFVILCVLGNSLYAQDRRVTGTVTQFTDGSTMPGVTVMVRGTTIGTVTDTDGRYTLTVPEGAVVVFSFVGMNSEEIAVGDRNLIDVALTPDVGLLEEIVVVGYGVQQRRDVSGAIASVRGDAIRNIPVQTFEQALQGKAAGVNITIPNAVLGNPPVIRVRGFNSISGSSSPLVVVDGVPVFTGDLSRGNASLNMLGDINPADIQSIEILKDASATAIYGSRAANGVILITTRRGTPGRTVVNYDASFGFTSPARLFDLMNAEQFVEIKNLARANNGQAPAYFLNYEIINGDSVLIDTDWSDVVFQRGAQQSHSFSFAGATAATNYFVSASFSTNEGILRTNEMTRKSARVNLDHRLNEFLSMGTNVAITNTFTAGPNSGSLPGSAFSIAGAGRIAMSYSPIVPRFVNTDTGFPVGDGTFYNIEDGNMGLLNNTQGVGWFHPDWMFKNNYSNATSDRVVGSVFVNLEPLDGLVFRSVFGLDNSGVETKTFNASGHGDGETRGGDAFNYFDRRNRWNWTNTVNFMGSVQDRFNYNFLAGIEEQHTIFDGWSGWRHGIADPFFTSYQGSFVTNATPPAALQTENYFLSYFGRINFNYDRRYYLEVSARRDGFSGLAAGRKFGNFGGASVMWNITNEPFFQNLAGDIFSDLRLKGSFGRVGNISGIANFGSLSLYSSGLFNDNPTFFFSQAGNPMLSWEASNRYDLGLAFALFNDRVQVDLNYYHNEITDLILDVPQAPSKGIPGNVVPSNVGTMFNRGFELSLLTHNIHTNRVTWTTTFNAATIRNEVTSLAPGVTSLIGGVYGDPGVIMETTNRTVVGEPIGNIWGVETAGVDPATGRRIFINGDGQKVLFNFGAPTAAERWMLEDSTLHRPIDITRDGKVLGSPIPRLFGGITNNFTFGSFDASVGITYALGFYIYNGSQAGLRDQRTWNNEVEVYETAWRNPGDITNIPRPVFGDNISNGGRMVISENVERGDFLKVRNVTLGYTLPASLVRHIGMTRLRVYVQGFNLLTITGYTGSDPEISSMGDTNLAPGVDRNTIPQARTIAFGVNATF